MRATYITAAIIAVLVVLWLVSGQLGDDNEPDVVSLAQENAALEAAAEDRAPTRVRARVINAEPFTQNLVLRGRTENKRTVMVRAETGGRIVNRPVERGDHVKTGQLLCQVAMDDRQAGLNEAREALNQARIEYEGALKLKTRGFQSDTAIAGAKARLASAEAQLERRGLEIQRTYIRAPFDGIVENTALEVGDYVTPGGECATVVDLNPMLLKGEVSERDVTAVKVGGEAYGVLADGREVKGIITFVGQQSSQDTRTYPIEVNVANDALELRSGITAEILLPVRQVDAHRISPALLALDDEGTVGVRILNADNRVEFVLVDILDDEPGGVWLRGLPDRAVVITVGQELVVAGEMVEVDMEATSEMPARAPEAERNSIAPTGSATQIASKTPVTS